MNDGVAIRAHRTQIRNWVDRVLGPDLRKLPDVVNVDEPFGEWAVGCAESEATRNTGRAVVSDAKRASRGVSLVRVDHHLTYCPFKQMRPWRYLLRKRLIFDDDDWRYVIRREVTFDSLQPLTGYGQLLPIKERLPRILENKVLNADLEILFAPKK